MPSKKPQKPTPMDLSLLYNAIDNLKPAKKSANTLPSGSTIPGPNDIPGLGGGSEMTGKTKSKKDPAAQAADRIEKGIKEAIDNATQQINRRLLGQLLHQRVRAVINANFHGQFTPAEIDRISNDAGRQAAYKLSDLTVIPDNYKAEIVNPGSGKLPNTEEPGSEQVQED